MKKYLLLCLVVLASTCGFAQTCTPDQCCHYNTSENFSANLADTTDHLPNGNHYGHIVVNKKCTYSPPPSDLMKSGNYKNVWMFYHPGEIPPPSGAWCGIEAEVTKINGSDVGDTGHNTTTDGDIHLSSYSVEPNDQILGYVFSNGQPLTIPYGVAMGVEACNLYDLTCLPPFISWNGYTATFTQLGGISGYSVINMNPPESLTCLPHIGD